MTKEQFQIELETVLKQKQLSKDDFFSLMEEFCYLMADYFEEKNDFRYLQFLGFALHFMDKEYFDNYLTEHEI
jgi:hypothetical protein